MYNMDNSLYNVKKSEIFFFFWLEMHFNKGFDQNGKTVNCSTKTNAEHVLIQELDRCIEFSSMLRCNAKK